MRRILTIAVMTTALAAGHSTTWGQAARDSSAGPPRTFRTERSKVARFIGSFVTATRISPGPALPNGAAGAGTMNVSWALDSMFLAIEEENTNPVLGHYRGHGMLGYDPQAREFVLSMFNNFGDRPTYRGNFAGDTLVLGTKIPMPLHPFEQKVVLYKRGETLVLQVLNDLGKGFQLSLDETGTPAK